MWSKTERRRGTCKFNWEEANCVPRQREGVAPVSLTGRRLTVWSKTERRRGTCKFNWEEANCVVQDQEKA